LHTESGPKWGRRVSMGGAWVGTGLGGWVSRWAVAVRQGLRLSADSLTTWGSRDHRRPSGLCGSPAAGVDTPPEAGPRARGNRRAGRTAGGSEGEAASRAAAWASWQGRRRLTSWRDGGEAVGVGARGGFVGAGARREGGNREGESRRETEIYIEIDRERYVSRRGGVGMDRLEYMSMGVMWENIYLDVLSLSLSLSLPPFPPLLSLSPCLHPSLSPSPATFTGWRRTVVVAGG
jgi:hypothetical protein